MFRAKAGAFMRGGFLHLGAEGGAEGGEFGEVAGVAEGGFGRRRRGWGR